MGIQGLQQCRIRTVSVQQGKTPRAPATRFTVCEAVPDGACVHDRGSQRSECSGAHSATMGRATPQKGSRRARAPTKVGWEI